MDYPVALASQLRQLLRSLRKARGWTQADLARRLGVVQSRVATIERDPGSISVEQLLRILALLGAQMVVRDGLPAGREGGDAKGVATRQRGAIARVVGEPGLSGNVLALAAACVVAV